MTKKPEPSGAPTKLTVIQQVARAANRAVRAIRTLPSDKLRRQAMELVIEEVRPAETWTPPPFVTHEEADIMQRGQPK